VKLPLDPFNEDKFNTAVLAVCGRGLLLVCLFPMGGWLRERSSWALGRILFRVALLARAVPHSRARENRQRATVSRIEDGSSPNIVIIDGANGWTGAGSQAANSAAYDRVRANANRLNGDEVSATNQVILAPVPGTTVHQPYTPAGQSAHDNRLRANSYRERSE
jgi:hypothetical protein